MPSGAVTVVMIDERIGSGAKAATTITSGKNETKAFPASATLRSTNSISSMRPTHATAAAVPTKPAPRPRRSRTSLMRLPGAIISTHQIGRISPGRQVLSKIDW
jgi:hypothetical protein